MKMRKGALCDTAQQKNLPVPQGVCTLHDMARNLFSPRFDLPRNAAPPSRTLRLPLPVLPAPSLQTLWAALQPFEWVWLFFLALASCTSGWLALRHGAPAWAPLPWLLLGAGVIYQHRAVACNRRLVWLFYPIGINVAFGLMRPAMALHLPWRADGVLQSIDQFLVGGNLSLAMQPWVRPWLSDAMSLGYMAFIPLLYGMQAVYLLRANRKQLGRMFRGLYLLYGIAFVGYLLLPALGPYLAMQEQFQVPIVGGWLTQFNAWGVPQGTNLMDVFPSLHVGISLYLWLTLWRDKRWLAALLSPLMVLLWLSTLYLRYHYAADVLAGAALALGCFFIAARGFARTA